MSKVYDAFGAVPPHIAPSIPVRRWDQALIAGAATFAVGYPLLLAAGIHLPGPELEGTFKHHLFGGLATAYHWATGGISMDQQAQAYAASLAHPWRAVLRVGTPLLLASLSTAWVLKQALIPRSNTWWVKGPRLLEDCEAIAAAGMRSLTKKQRLADPGHLALHPSLVLAKKHWSRHTFIYGSVGSGKTQILLPIIQQIIDRNDKLFLYDVKGDMTAKFRRPIIVSPFDRRSYQWDVARDVRTPTQAAAFAASIIPEDAGNGRFWTTAAQQLLTGALRMLQNTKGTKWSWTDLADAVAQTAPDMLPMLMAHYAKAAPLIANTEGQSTASVLATLAGYTRVIDDLALAWPKRSKRSFSITNWVRDDYKGRKQIIVQAGPDPQLTRAYISAMLNVMVPSIISPQLPDNESGRFIGFVLDELPSLGKINLPPLIDKGRSKGVVCVLAAQDLAQVRQVYGDLEAKALTGMVGTHIICQIGLGETRDQLAQMLGKQKIAYRTHEADSSVHEESRALITGAELTDRLGFRKSKHMGPHGWGIRAIVQMGGDPLLLDFPGIQFPDKRKGQEPAKWTLGPAGSKGGQGAAVATPSPQETQRVLALSMDEVKAEMDRIYGNE